MVLKIDTKWVAIRIDRPPWNPGGIEGRVFLRLSDVPLHVAMSVRV